MFRLLCARIRVFISLFSLCLLAAMGVACGGGTGTNPVQTPVPANQPTFAHVVLVIEENHSFSEVIGNSAMAYLNGQAQLRSISPRRIPHCRTISC